MDCSLNKYLIFCLHFLARRVRGDKVHLQGQTPLGCFGSRAEHPLLACGLL